MGPRPARRDRVGRRCDPTWLAQFLSLVPGRRVHREDVIDALWSDALFNTGANRLHKAAHYLRKLIGVTRQHGYWPATRSPCSPRTEASVEVDVDQDAT